MEYRADDIYGAVVSALETNRLDCALAGSERLLEIDADQERALITHGMVLLQLNRLDEAKEFLERSIRKFGDSGAALTNLAKVLDGQGQKEAAQKMLRHSLHVDPNQNAGLVWYVSICHERSGTIGMIEALEEIRREPDSWRAMLWLTRVYLDGGQLETAMAMYRKSLSMGFDSDALFMISGDLGKHGFPEESIDLVNSRFVPGTHDPRVGLNLLQNFLDLGLGLEGQQLLSSMREYPHDAIMRELAWYEQKLMKLA